jgi:hypothetical protein
MLTVADIMHPEGQIFLRPEFGRLDNNWPAMALIPHAYSQLDYRSGSGRLVGGAILVTGKERLRLMQLPVTKVELTLSQEVIEYQEQLKRIGR